MARLLEERPIRLVAYQGNLKNKENVVYRCQLLLFHYALSSLSKAKYIMEADLCQTKSATHLARCHDIEYNSR